MIYIPVEVEEPMEANTGEVIFKYLDALSASYVPEVIIGRDSQITQLRTTIAPLLHGGTAPNILLFGKPGSGKTSTAKYTLKYESNGNNSLKIVYINCNQFRTESGVIRSICKVIDPSKRVPERGIDIEFYYQILWEVYNQFGGISIVVLDEIDRLKKRARTVVNMLSRAKSEDRVTRGNISVIGISNDSRFMNELGADTLSSLTPKTIVFPAYNAAELKSILNDRAIRAFNDGVLDESVVPLCAALAASEHGDARKALDLLNTSGWVAVESGCKEVNEEHVRIAEARYNYDVVKQLILSLPLQQKVILVGIVRGFDVLAKRRGTPKRRLTSGDVYDFYLQACQIYNIEPINQRHITEYVDELSLQGILNSFVISKGRYGRTKEISLYFDKSLILPLLDDSIRHTHTSASGGDYAKVPLAFPNF